MGMNPLVGHKVDRYWAEVRVALPHNTDCCCKTTGCYMQQW